MRTFRFMNLTILSILIGSTALLYAQDEKQEDKPARQEEAKPQPKQDEARPAHPEEAKPARPEAEEKRGQEEHPGMQRDQDHQGRPEQRAENGRPAGKGGHIPDDKFRAHYGRTHTFTAKTVIVSGQPRFHYADYDFQLVDAWPVGWAYTDECYIDYVDGEYFLFDVLHPGVRIAIFVVM